MGKNVVKMPLSYFLDDAENGSISLSKLSQRVDDASKMLNDGNVIELDNGVLCSTRDELFFAVSQAKNPQITNEQHSQVESGKSGASISSEKVVKICIVSLFVAALLWIIIWFSCEQTYTHSSFSGSIGGPGLPDGYGLPVYLGLYAVCVAIGILINKNKKE